MTGGRRGKATAAVAGTHSILVIAYHGKGTAAVARAHSILVIAPHLLTEGSVDRALSATYVDERDRGAVERRLVHRRQGLGYRVSLEPVA